MPYITKSRIAELQKPGHLGDIKTPGELVYVLTYALGSYFGNTQPITYTTITEVLGALEGCKLELYRRLVVPYEEKKRRENGDVFIAADGRTPEERYSQPEDK